MNKLIKIIVAAAIFFCLIWLGLISYAHYQGKKGIAGVRDILNRVPEVRELSYAYRLEEPETVDFESISLSFAKNAVREEKGSTLILSAPGFGKLIILKGPTKDEVDIVKIMTGENTEFPGISGYLESNQRMFGNRLEMVLGYTLNRTPDEISFFDPSYSHVKAAYEFLKLKSESMAAGGEKYMADFSNKYGVRGFQFCSPTLCKNTIVEVFPRVLDEYVLIMSGMDQDALDFVLNSIR